MLSRLGGGRESASPFGVPRRRGFQPGGVEEGGLPCVESGGARRGCERHLANGVPANGKPTAPYPAWGTGGAVIAFHAGEQPGPLPGARKVKHGPRPVAPLRRTAYRARSRSLPGPCLVSSAFRVMGDDQDAASGPLRHRRAVVRVSPAERVPTPLGGRTSERAPPSGGPNPRSSGWPDRESGTLLVHGKGRRQRLAYLGGRALAPVPRHPACRFGRGLPTRARVLAWMRRLLPGNSSRPLRIRTTC